MGLAEESSLAYPGRRVVLGSAIGVFVGFGSLLVYTFGIFLKPLAEEFAWSRQSVSLAFGFAAIALAASSPILGLLLDRFGPRGVILVTALFLASLCQNGVVTHLSALLTDRGVAAGGAAIAISTLGASSLIGRLVAGWLLDRFFAPRLGCGLLLCATLGTFLLSSMHSASMGILAAGLIGAGMGGETDVTPYLLSRYFGLRLFSTLYGFTWTAYAIAGAIGPVRMGKAFDVTGSYTAFLLNLVFVAIAASSLMLLFPGYRKKDRSPHLEALVPHQATASH